MLCESPKSVMKSRLFVLSIAMPYGFWMPLAPPQLTSLGRLLAVPSAAMFSVKMPVSTVPPACAGERPSGAVLSDTTK